MSDGGEDEVVQLHGTPNSFEVGGDGLVEPGAPRASISDPPRGRKSASLSAQGEVKGVARETPAPVLNGAGIQKAAPDPAEAIPNLLTEAEEAPSTARSGGPKSRTPLRDALLNIKRLLLYSHMNPDPDTIGASLGLKQLLEARYGKVVGLCYRGIVGRAENRRMLELLAPEMKHAREVDQDDYDAAFLVDAQPDFGIDLQQDLLPLAGVVDHHPYSGGPSEIPFYDVRPDYGATSTIITEYFRAEGLEPTPTVATALFYGLKTDTLDLSRRTSPADVRAYKWLFSRVDRLLLAEIENPPLSRDYFDNVAAAITRAVAYRATVITEVGSAPYPDMVAQIADSLIRLKGFQWSVCFGMHDQRIYFSVRTTHPTRDAGHVVKRVLGDEGVGGGHDTMAAGRVQLLEESEETYLRVVGRLWWRFLQVLGEEGSEGRRLVRNLPSPSQVVPAP